jgi:hypothetical protein
MQFSVLWMRGGEILTLMSDFHMLPAMETMFQGWFRAVSTGVCPYHQKNDFLSIFHSDQHARHIPIRHLPVPLIEGQGGGAASGGAPTRRKVGAAGQADGVVR